jgi:adenosylhomocysteine nucleosidase
MREEVAPLLGRLRDRSAVVAGGCRFERGTLGGSQLAIAWTGVGGERAVACFAQLAGEVPVSGLLVLGVAGGLSPRLEAGSLFVADELRLHGVAIPPPDAALLARARQTGSPVSGTLLTTDEIVDRPDKKEALRQAHAAGTTSAVDMESAYLGRFAAEHRIPYLVVRAISDTSAETIPPFLDRCRTPDGAFDGRRVTRYALSHPWVIPTLLHLRSRVRRCARALATFVARFERAADSRLA